MLIEGLGGNEDGFAEATLEVRTVDTSCDPKRRKIDIDQFFDINKYLSRDDFIDEMDRMKYIEQELREMIRLSYNMDDNNSIIL
jgi:translation elongation factor EF-Tu-like GTPase